MRIIRGSVITLAISALGFVEAPAQGLTGKFAVVPMVGANMPIQYLQGDEGGQATLGFVGGLAGEYFISDDLSVGAHAAFNRFGTDLPLDELSGNWTMIQFGAFGRYRFLPGQTTRPYARAGVLMGNAKLKIENGGEREAEIGFSLGGEVAGGVTHQLQDNLLLFGEIGWTGLATDGKDVDITVNGEELEPDESEKHIQWIGVKLGVIFLFGGTTQ